MDSIDNWGEGEQLVDVLQDKSARWDERDDAAMDLAGANTPEALRALLMVGQDATEDETLQESVGESIVELLHRNPEWKNHDDISQLAPATLRAYKAYQAHKSKQR